MVGNKSRKVLAMLALFALGGCSVQVTLPPPEVIVVEAPQPANVSVNLLQVDNKFELVETAPSAPVETSKQTCDTLKELYKVQTPDVTPYEDAERSLDLIAVLLNHVQKVEKLIAEAKGNVECN